LFTKPVATQAGITFTIVLYAVFLMSKRMNASRQARRAHDLEQFNILAQDKLTAESIGCEFPRRKLVAVRSPKRLEHLRKCLDETDPDTTDIVVMKANILTGIANTQVDTTIDTDAEELFSQVIKLAEKEGKTVIPIVVPTNNVAYAIAHTAAQLGAEEVLIGTSDKYPAEYQLQQFALHWGMVEADERHRLLIRSIGLKSELRVEL
jgi:hypothetical protein